MAVENDPLPEGFKMTEKRLKHVTAYHRWDVKDCAVVKIVGEGEYRLKVTTWPYTKETVDCVWEHLHPKDRKAF